MPKRAKHVFDVLFVGSSMLFAGALWLQQACASDDRTYLFGCTIITHQDRTVVIRDWSNQLTTHTFAQSPVVGLLQMASGVYIIAWIGWRGRALLPPSRKIQRGFDVIQ